MEEDFIFTENFFPVVIIYDNGERNCKKLDLKSFKNQKSLSQPLSLAGSVVVEYETMFYAGWYIFSSPALWDASLVSHGV